MNETMVYGPEPLCPRVVTAEPMADFMLLLTFTNGERRVFDAEFLLSMPAYAPLKNKGLFDAVRVAYGTIEWPGGIDRCPDTLYIESTPEDNRQG